MVSCSCLVVESQLLLCLPHGAQLKPGVCLQPLTTDGVFVEAVTHISYSDHSHTVFVLLKFLVVSVQ